MKLLEDQRDTIKKKNVVSSVVDDETQQKIDVFFFSSRRWHTSCSRDWSSDVCSSDLCVGHVVSPFFAVGVLFCRIKADHIITVCRIRSAGQARRVRYRPSEESNMSLLRSLLAAEIGRAPCRERV